MEKNIHELTRKRAKFLVFFGFLFLCLAYTQTAQTVNLYSQVDDQVRAGKATSGLSVVKDPRIVAVSIIKIFLSLIGTIFLILIAIASFWYITARGEESKIEKATSTIRGAVIGLLIVIMAYSITYFVSKNVQKAIGVRTSGSLGFFL